MMRNKKLLFWGIGLFLSFVIWTLALGFIDIQPIGVNGEYIGFASLNSFVHDYTGVNMFFYSLGDFLSIIPLGIVAVFGCMGFVQLIKRVSIFKVNKNILALGVFYVIVLLIYVFFETIVVNYRPVLIDGQVESSYPSSTTMLVLCVMITVFPEIRRYVKNMLLRRILSVLVLAFVLFMIALRILSGVHWFSDIIGGILLGLSLSSVYIFILRDGLKI